MKNLSVVSALFLLCSSCGNTYLHSEPASGSAVPLAASQGGASSTSGTQSSFMCPSDPNILPEESEDYSQGDEFTVCPSSQTSSAILINGQTVSSPEICVIPVNVVNGQDNPYPNSAQCATASSSSGIILSFTGVSYNAVIIMEGPYESMVQSCLQNGDLGACAPYYSFGEFR